MWPLLFLGLLGCGGAPDASPDVAPPPRPRDLRLDAPWIVAGDRAALTVTGAPAGATVWFAVSGAGLGSGPCPAAIGSCLDVRNPITVLGSAVADAAGVAQYAVRVPNPAPAFAAFQAAILGSPGLVSNPLPRWLLPAGTPLGDALDADGDGWTQGGGDCDDASAAVRPGAPDARGDGRDTDCDGIDGADADGDGARATPGGGDCDDWDAAIGPQAAELCDGVDQDCDGQIDDGVPGDGAGCGVEPSPTFPEVIGTLHIGLLTGSGVNDGTDSNQLSLCLNATACFPLNNDTWDDFESGQLDVFIVEGVDLPRAAVDRVEIRSTNGTDAWRPACAELRFDGEPVHCAPMAGPWFGDDAGEVGSWIDPLGLHAACDTCAPAMVTHGPIVGAVGPRSAELWVRTDAAREIEVRVGLASPLSPADRVTTRWTEAGSDFAEVVRVEGLAPDTAYQYEVLPAGGAPVSGAFRTGPDRGPGAFRFSFGSCARDANQPIFATIDSLDPDFFLFVGDNHYGNTGELSDLRQWYRFAHSRPERAAMMRHVPTVAVWDDHDFVGNDTLGDAPGKENALRAFREYWANDSYGTPETPGIFSTWWWGDVELFLLDDRYWRGLDGNLLGDAQTAWLLSELRASDATFKLLVTGSQWTPDGSADSWAAWPQALDDLLVVIADEAIGGVVFLSGDVHRSELRTVPPAPGGYRVPELTSSPLANSNFGCPNDRDLRACVDDRDLFIEVAVDTTLPDPTLTASIRDVTGAALHAWTIYRSELQPHEPVPWSRERADLDGDGYDDLAVGAPRRAAGGIADAGAVHVVSGGAAGLDASRGDALYAQDLALLPGSPEAGDRFGGALAWGDFDHDGISDLAVGVPDEAIGATASAGFVEVLYGHAAAVVDARGYQPGSDGIGGSAQAQARFGAALAAADFDGDGYADLAVGAPGRSVGGAVTVIYGGPGGLDGPTAQLLDQENTGGVTADEAGDQFGASLAAGDFDGDGYADLAIGHPGEAIGATAGAGMFTVVFGGPGGLTSGAADQTWHQDTSGVPGSVESGDHFGSTLAAGDVDGDGIDDLAVAAEDEAIGAVAGAGFVIVFKGTTAGLTATGVQSFELSSAAFATSPGAGDALGAALAVGDLDGDGFADLVMGAPGRAVGGAAGAGAALALRGGAAGLALTGFVWVDEGRLAGAAPAAGERLGASLGAGDFDGDGRFDLVVGVPREDVAGLVDAGLVYVVPGGPPLLQLASARAWSLGSPGVAWGAGAGDAYGEVLP